MNGRGGVGRKRRLFAPGVLGIAAGVLVLSGVVAAQDRAFDMDAFFRKVFLTREIRTKSVGPIRWVEGGEGLAAIEASESVKGAKDVVRYETATNKREVVLSAADLKVAGVGAPLIVENCDWSADGNLALIYTNSQRVWRANTRGDYWVFDRRTKKLRKLGGDAAPATLMFATFSPDGTRVAYVHANNIYVESATGGGVTQIGLGVRGRVSVAAGLPVESGWEVDRLLAVRYGEGSEFSAALQRGRALRRGHAYSVSAVWGVSGGERDSVSAAGDHEFVGEGGSCGGWSWGEQR
jgi:hypothetical protein